MEPFESFEHAGFTVELHPDYDSGGPGEWDNLGDLFSFERGNELQGFAERSDSVGQSFEAQEKERPGLTVRYLRACGYHAVLFQYQDYGSSGARVLALDDDDDAIATGYIACSFEKMTSDGPVDGDARRALVGELSNWDAWVEGRVVGYVVRDTAGEVVDSCWGFYPEDFTREERDRYGRPTPDDGYEYVRGEARSAAESERDERARRAREVREGWAFARGGSRDLVGAANGAEGVA